MGEPTEAEKRKEEEILENKLAYQLQASETADEKRRRENAQIEAADNALTNEMFDSSDSQKKSDGNSIASSVAGAVLKKKQDHVDFAIIVANKLSESTPFNTSAFYKELTKKIKAKLSLEVLEEVVESLTALRDGMKKKSVNDSSKEKNKVQAKAQKQNQQDHEDIYGGNSVKRRNMETNMDNWRK